MIIDVSVLSKIIKLHVKFTKIYLQNRLRWYVAKVYIHTNILIRMIDLVKPNFRHFMNFTASLMVKSARKIMIMRKKFGRNSGAKIQVSIMTYTLKLTYLYLQT